MKLTIEELKAFGAEVLEGVSDTARLSEIVTKITEGYIEYSNDNILLVAKNEELVKEINSLREQNMQLYLKVGTPEPKKEEETKEKEEEKEVSVDELFDENGNLK